jgi:hypothetical protein
MVDEEIAPSLIMDGSPADASTWFVAGTQVGSPTGAGFNQI